MQVALKKMVKPGRRGSQQREGGILQPDKAGQTLFGCFLSQTMLLKPRPSLECGGNVGG